MQITVQYAMSMIAGAGRGVKWTAACQWATTGFSFVVFAYLSRLLAPADFGLFALVLVVVSLALVAFNAVFREPLVQRVELSEEDRSTLFWSSLLLGVAISLATYFLAGVAADVFHDSRMAPVLRLLSLKILGDAAASVPTALLLRRFDFTALGLMTLVINVAAGAIAVGLGAAGFGVWALAVQQLAISAGTLAAVSIRARWLPRLAWRWPVQRSFLAFSGSVASWQALDFLNRQLDRAIIGDAIGLTALGLYAAGRRLNDLLIDTTAGVLAYVAFPIFSRIQADPERVRGAYLKAVSLLVFFSFPASFGLLALSPRLVPLALGAQWTGAVPIVQAFAVTGIIRAIGTMQAIVLRSMGKPSWWLKYLLLQNAANVIVLLFVVRFGIYWTAVAIVAREYALWPVSFVMVQRLLKIATGDYLRAFVRPLAASAAMVAAIYARDRLLPVEAGDVALLCVDALLGASVYLAVCLGADGERTREVLRVVSQVTIAKARA